MENLKKLFTMIADLIFPHEGGLIDSADLIQVLRDAEGKS